GGGLRNDGTMTLTNCTISNNSSSFGSGGGLDNAGIVTLTNCTITANRARDYQQFINGVYNFHLGGGIYNSGTATLTNTIVAANPTGGDVTSAMNYITHVMGDGNLSASSSHNLIGGNPLLAPLGVYTSTQNYATPTCPLLPGSPAIDAGISGAGIPAADQ